MRTYQDFYQSLEKPFFAPPEWVFGFAWGIIYPLIMVAAGMLVYHVFFKKNIPKPNFYIFVTNIVGNILFTPVQLGVSPLWPATIVIGIIVGTLIWFQYRIYKYSLPIFILLTPYLIWGIFAAILQCTLTILNS